MTTRSTNNSIVMLFIATIVTASYQPAAAQNLVDTVITQQSGSTKTVKRRGSIADWKGMSLTLVSNGREREIDNDEIVEVRTSWSQEYLIGQQLLQAGKVKESIVSLKKALATETRPWAKRIIRAELMEAFQSASMHAAAVDQFVQILREDRNSRFIDQAPLPWAGGGANLIEPARNWIKTNDPVAQLLGASWLIASPDRQQAIKTLEDLSRDIDPRIKNLAIAQLWRTRTKVNQKQTEVWSKLVDKMPREIRAGPYFVLADVQSRAQLPDKALLNLMKIRILYPKQRSLSAAALYRAAQLLHNKKQSKQAQTILSELTTLYPETVWAQQANQ